MLFVDIACHFIARSGVHNLSIFHELFLLPGGNPWIKVAWTLRHELLFYGLFLLAIIDVRLGTIVFAAWLAAIVYFWIVAGERYLPSDTSRPALQTLLSPINVCFFAGIAIALLVRSTDFAHRIRLKAPRSSAWLGEISYPLYLCHLTVYFVIGGIFAHLRINTPPWPVYLLIIVSASILFSRLIFQIFERPVLRYLKTIVVRRGDVVTKHEYS